MEIVPKCANMRHNSNSTVRIRVTVGKYLQRKKLFKKSYGSTYAGQGTFSIKCVLVEKLFFLFREAGAERELS